MQLQQYWIDENFIYVFVIIKCMYMPQLYHKDGTIFQPLQNPLQGNHENPSHHQISPTRKH